MLKKFLREILVAPNERLPTKKGLAEKVLIIFVKSFQNEENRKKLIEFFKKEKGSQTPEKLDCCLTVQMRTSYFLFSERLWPPHSVL